MDKDQRFSTAKTGGYHWADAWIDPSVQLAGIKDHPTMSVEDSYRKQRRFQTEAQAWKTRQKRKFSDEDDDF